jgi:hypothetical protein
MRLCLLLGLALPALAPGQTAETNGVGAAAPPVKVSDEIVIAADGYGKRLRGCQAVCHGKDQFLAVWREGWIGQGGNSRVVAARLGVDGKPLDAQAIMLAPSATQRQDRPRVAFCGDKYLVVWQEFNGKDMDVYGVRIGLDGKVLDAKPLAIAAAPRTQVMPEVASDGKDGFLVVWMGYQGEETGPRGFAVRVGSDGTVGTPVAHSCSPAPKVVWSGTHYLVWGGPIGVSSTLALQKIAPDGKLNGASWRRLGTADNIGSDGCIIGGPHTSIGYRPEGGWLIVTDRAAPDFWGWSGPGAMRSYAMGPDAKLVADQPTEDGAPAFGKLQPNWLDVVKGDVAKRTWPFGRSGVVWDGTKWLVVWTSFHFGGRTGIDLVNGDIVLARVDGWKSREGMTPLVVSGTAANELNPALATDGAGTTLCVYEKQPEDAKSNMAICVRAIDTRK